MIDTIYSDPRIVLAIGFSLVILAMFVGANAPDFTSTARHKVIWSTMMIVLMLASIINLIYGFVYP